MIDRLVHHAEILASKATATASKTATSPARRPKTDPPPARRARRRCSASALRASAPQHRQTPTRVVHFSTGATGPLFRPALTTCSRHQLRLPTFESSGQLPRQQPELADFADYQATQRVCLEVPKPGRRTWPPTSRSASASDAPPLAAALIPSPSRQEVDRSYVEKRAERLDLPWCQSPRFARRRADGAAAVRGGGWALLSSASHWPD